MSRVLGQKLLKIHILGKQLIKPCNVTETGSLKCTLLPPTPAVYLHQERTRGRDDGSLYLSFTLHFAPSVSLGYTCMFLGSMSSLRFTKTKIWIKKTIKTKTKHNFSPVLWFLVLFCLKVLKSQGLFLGSLIHRFLILSNAVWGLTPRHHGVSQPGGMHASICYRAEKRLLGDRVVWWWAGILCFPISFTGRKWTF